jgi:hypothetical protein
VSRAWQILIGISNMMSNEMDEEELAMKNSRT